MNEINSKMQFNSNNFDQPKFISEYSNKLEFSRYFLNIFRVLLEPQSSTEVTATDSFVIDFENIK